jgi:hypothetical protein
MKLQAADLAPLLRKSGLEIESEIRGSSMHPTLPAGTRIRIRCGNAPYRPGDIVAIVADPPIAHRVISCLRRGSRDYVITRGDASWYCDLPVVEEQILGVVTAQLDADGWRAPSACQAPEGLTGLLASVSHRLMRAALRVSDNAASLVARAGGAVAARRGERG